MTETRTSGDAVAIRTAAALLDLTPDRVGQLIRGGHAISPGRGLVNLSSLLRGYTALLRVEASRPASAALAAHQSAKAQIIAETTSQRRSALTLRADAEQSINLIADVAVAQLRTLAKRGDAALRGLPPDVHAAIRTEALAAGEAIKAARDAAITALTSGDFAEIEGVLK